MIQNVSMQSLINFIMLFKEIDACSLLASLQLGQDLLQVIATTHH